MQRRVLFLRRAALAFVVGFLTLQNIEPPTRSIPKVRRNLMAKCTRKPLTAQAVEETMEAHRAAPGLHPSPLTRGVHGHALCPLREPDAARAVHPQAGAGLGRGADRAAAVQAVDGRGAGAGGGGDTTDVPLSAIGEVGRKANHPPLGTKTGSNRRNR